MLIHIPEIVVIILFVIGSLLVWDTVRHMVSYFGIHTLTDDFNDDEMNLMFQISVVHISVRLIVLGVIGYIVFTHGIFFAQKSAMKDYETEHQEYVELNIDRIYDDYKKRVDDAQLD